MEALFLGVMSDNRLGLTEGTVDSYSTGRHLLLILLLDPCEMAVRKV